MDGTNTQQEGGGIDKETMENKRVVAEKKKTEKQGGWIVLKDMAEQTTVEAEGRDRWRRLVEKAAIDGDDWLRRPR